MDRLATLAHWFAAGWRTNGPSWLATGSLLALSVGCGLERPSLALIVPGALVFACVVFAEAVSLFRGGPPDA